MAHPETEIKAQGYLRLMRYAAPYKVRMAVGVLAGLLAGGSLFGSFMMIPHLMRGLDPDGGASAAVIEERDLAKAHAVLAAADDPAHPDAISREAAVAEALAVKRGRSIAEEVAAWRARAARWNLPLDFSYEDGVFRLHRPFSLSLRGERPDGRLHWQFFSLFVVGFVILWFLKNLAVYINRYLTRWVGARVVADLRNEVFGHLLRQSLRFYGKIDVGQLISRCTHDTAAIESAIAHTIADFTRCPFEILACVAGILYGSYLQQDWSLPIILFIGLPAAILPLILLGRRIRKVYRKSFAKIADVVSRMHEVFTGILIVKAYHAEERENGVFRNVNRRYLRTVVSALKLELLMAPAMEVVAVTATLVFLVYSYSQGVTVTQLAQLLIPAFMAYAPLKSLAKIRTYLERSMAAADRYFQLLDTDTALPEQAAPIALRDFRDRVAFRDVAFEYEPGKRILDGFSLEIPKGSIVAVVGQTGSGKTTIANLLARFYDVSAGTVTIDGVDVRDASIASLRDLIGIVTQDAILFNETIADNIAYGRPDASLAEIEAAARQANAHQFITGGKHPEGYRTVVGEKGFRLSGGEKQRVAIARAILKNPPILILDEATSALDTVTERLVQEALDHLMENRTVFAIAHRLSTVRHADLIIVLDHGRIVEQGTHDQLLALDGAYRRLHDMQFSGGPAAPPEA